MRLLFVLENYYPNIGGVETLFQNLMEALAKKGHNVQLVTHRLKGTKKYEVLKGVKIHRIECFQNRYMFSFLAIPKTLSLAERADIIHTTTYNGALPAIIAAMTRGKPSIITVHEILGKNWERFEMGLIAKKLHRFLEMMITKMPFDRFVAVSSSTRKQLLGSVNTKKIAVVHNGVDYTLLDPKKYDGESVRKKLGLEKKYVYIAYGRPGITKGIEHLIRAEPIIRENIPNSKLLLVLSERDKRIGQIRKLIRKMGLEGEILLLGSMRKEELLKHVKAADLVIVPSLTEGFGYAAIEACEMGKPIVASNTTSIPEVIYGRYVLVRPGDPEAIAAGVEMAHKGKVMKGKRKVFTIKNNVEGYLKVYSDLERNKK